MEYQGPGADMNGTDMIGSEFFFDVDGVIEKEGKAIRPAVKIEASLHVHLFKVQDTQLYWQAVSNLYLEPD